MYDAAPIVGRPRGNAWRALQADGIVWEGQVYLIGDQVDLAARLVLTRRRLTFSRGGVIALEADLEWLEPAPIMSRLGDVTVFLDPEGTGDPERIRVQFRDGRASADDFMRAIGAGVEAPTRRTPSSWDRWGSASSLAANFTDGSETDRSVDQPATSWESYDSGFRSSLLDTDDFPPIAGEEPAPPIPPSLPASSDEPVSFAPSAAFAPSTPVSPQASRWLVPIDGLTPKQRFLPRRSFSFRLAGLGVLLAVSAAFGAGVLPVPGIDTVSYPGASNDAVGGGVAQVAPDAAATDDAPAADDVTPDETAIALGVGGSNGEPIAMAETPTPAPIEPTATETTVEEAVATAVDPTDAAIVPAAGASAASAAAAVDAPAQVVVARAFRATVLSANRAAEFPDLGLASTGENDWVVVVADVTNASDGEAPFRMTAFSLETAGGGEISLDGRTAAVATALGIDPAFDPGTALRFAAGETYRVALVFAVPAGSDGVRLRFAEQGIDLGLPLDQAADPFAIASAAGSATVTPATVLQVIDATTLSVDIDGVATTVRIAGIDAPLAGACYSSEAAFRATELLGGKVVLLEDSGAALDGLPLLDVWVIDPDGKSAPALAAATLAAQGAATANPALGAASYSAWIAASASAADTKDNGLWGACGI